MTGNVLDLKLTRLMNRTDHAQPLRVTQSTIGFVQRAGKIHREISLFEVSSNAQFSPAVMSP